MIAMRLVHVVSGVLWVGSVAFIAALLLPALRATGPASGAVMQQMGKRIPPLMLTTSLLTVLSGLGLYARDSGGFSSSWMRSGQGLTFGTGGILALIAVIHGMAVNSPTGKRMGMLAAGMERAGGPAQPEQMAEMQRLQARLSRATTLAAALLVSAAALMGVARYVR
ncbi:MAG: hypothetical protein ABI637_10310 [Gemmatimonadota bacterium]